MSCHVPFSFWLDRPLNEFNLGVSRRPPKTVYAIAITLGGLSGPEDTSEVLKTPHVFIREYGWKSQDGTDQQVFSPLAFKVQEGTMKAAGDGVGIKSLTRL